MSHDDDVQELRPRRRDGELVDAFSSGIVTGVVFGWAIAFVVWRLFT